jgi:hypothetical protein
MIKRYCDCCGDEITDRNKLCGGRSRLTGEIHNRKSHMVLRVEVIVAKDNTWNDGDFCKYCVIDAIMLADDRPQGVKV